MKYEKKFFELPNRNFIKVTQIFLRDSVLQILVSYKTIEENILFYI